MQLGPTVKLWDVTAQRELAVLPHEGWVLAAAFSADGKTLATFCKNDYLHLWEVATRRELKRLAVGDTAEFRWDQRAAFSPGGDMLALDEGTGTVYLWDVARGTRVGFLHAGRGALCLAFSPNGRTLAVGAEQHQDPGVGVWDISRPERPESILLLTNTAEVGWASSLAFSFDGKTLAEGCGNGAIELWDLATERVIQTLTNHSAWVSAMAFSSDGKRLASASADHTACLWDVATGRGATLRGHLNEVWALAMAPDGRTVATGTRRTGLSVSGARPPSRRNRPRTPCPSRSDWRAPSAGFLQMGRNAWRCMPTERWGCGTSPVSRKPKHSHWT